MVAQEKLDELVQKEKEKEHRRLFTDLELIEHEAEAVAEVTVHQCVCKLQWHLFSRTTQS